VVQANDFLQMFPGLANFRGNGPQQAAPQGGQPSHGQMTPEAIKLYRQLALQQANQKITSGQSGPYQTVNGWNALAQGLSAIPAAYMARQANNAELANIHEGAGAMPNLGDYGNTRPAMGGGAAGQPGGQPGAQPGPQADAGPDAGGAAAMPSLPTSLSAQDRDAAIRTVLGEAGDQGHAGMAGVAHVIKNRVTAGYAPDVSGVVFQRGQFEPWMNPQTAASLRAVKTDSPQYQAAGQVVDGVFGGAIPDVTKGATHFYAPQLQHDLGRNDPAWSQSFPMTAQIGGHAFYQDPHSAPKLAGAQGPMGQQQFAQANPQQGAPSGLPPLPSDEQIHAMLSNPDPEFRQLGIQLYQHKQQALQPQFTTEPSGRQMLYSPYAGVARPTGIMGKPDPLKMPYNIEGVYSSERPVVPQMGPGGQPYLQSMPIVPPGGTPPGGEPENIGQVPPMQRPFSPPTMPGGGPQGMPGGPQGAPPPQGGMPQGGARPGAGSWGGNFQPMGAQGAPGGMPQGPAAGFMPVGVQGGQPGLNVGPSGAPLANSQTYGDMAGPGAAGPMPNPDTASPQELVAWKQRRDAESKGMGVQAEAVSKALGDAHAKAITAAANAPQELQQLAILEDAYKQPHVPGGPLAEHWAVGRAIIREIFGPKVADEVPATQLIDKTNTALSFKAAGELTSRPALLEVLAAMRSNPGTKMTDQTALYLINLMQQQKAQDRQLGTLARHTMDSRDFLDKQDAFYDAHPLVSPFTGRPLLTAADFKGDLDRTVQQSEGHGLGGAVPFPYIAEPDRKPGAAPAQGQPQAPTIRRYNEETGRLE
jgi:Cell Wall Hydrolase